MAKQREKSKRRRYSARWCLLWVPLGGCLFAGLWFGARTYVNRWEIRLTARDLILRETARAGEAIPEGEEANLADSMRRWREADRVVHVVGRQFAAEASGAARKKGSDPLRPRGLTPSPA